MIDAVPFTMERFRSQLRVERKTRVGGRDKLAGQVGVAKSTIQNAEMGPDVPGIDTVARLVEGMPGLTLSMFFAKIEESSDVEATAADGAAFAREDNDDSLPAFDTEERIAERFLRRLARYAIKGLESDENQRQTDYRLPPNARPAAAERSAHARKVRPRHVPKKKKKR